ncbi:MAG: SRPBCC domain-containing protein, partial [Nitrosomonadales bacterium]|nr:SRPBCC domain-containing protein [Nitrosomonadales bacterium]
MTFQTSREIAAPPSSVFAAFADSARFAAWWGPAGFTNTFKICEFEPGGKWSYVMHGPGGKNYPNESVFRDIEPSKRIVIHHVSQPRYLLTVSLEPTNGGGTLVRWEQDFEDPRVASGIEHIVVPANEQNLDRLSAVVLGSPDGR